MKILPLNAAVAAALAVSAGIALTACDRTETREASRKMENAVESAAVKTEAAAESAVQTAVATVQEAAITASVKGELVRDNELSALKIDVDTREGVVTLNGKAPSAEAALRAERIAIAVNGVTAVRNNLTIGG